MGELVAEATFPFNGILNGLCELSSKACDFVGELVRTVPFLETRRVPAQQSARSSESRASASARGLPGSCQTPGPSPAGLPRAQARALPGRKARRDRVMPSSERGYATRSRGPRRQSASFRSATAVLGLRLAQREDATGLVGGPHEVWAGWPPDVARRNVARQGGEHRERVGTATQST
jgi:hypothetical protein